MNPVKQQKKEEKLKNRLRNKKADFTVLMLGQRRSGKSSVLASMVSGMQKLCVETGFAFRADPDTQLLMDSKQSELRLIFSKFGVDECFNTMNLTKESATTQPFRYLLGLTGRDDPRNDKIIDFIDIRGEDLTQSLDGKFEEYLKSSSVIVIAVDSPALMENKQDNGVGKYHDSVNLPVAIYQSIVEADNNIRRKLKRSQAEISPKLILFVPLKCEKYYYSNRMDELKDSVKNGYKNLFNFFEAKTEYTVAITPILTLGDVIFDHYGTKTLPNGKEVISMLGDEKSAVMAAMPAEPMYRFRNQTPRFSAKYCEQPLMYLLSFVNCVINKAEKTARITKTSLAAVLAFILFQGYGLAAVAILDFVRNRDMRKAIKQVSKHMKSYGDGYEIVIDRIGLKKG